MVFIVKVNKILLEKCKFKWVFSRRYPDGSSEKFGILTIVMSIRIDHFKLTKPEFLILHL